MKEGSEGPRLAVIRESVVSRRVSLVVVGGLSKNHLAKSGGSLMGECLERR